MISQIKVEMLMNKEGIVNNGLFLMSQNFKSTIVKKL